jgi:hypothetical protein
MLDEPRLDSVHRYDRDPDISRCHACRLGDVLCTTQLVVRRTHDCRCSIRCRPERLLVHFRHHNGHWVLQPVKCNRLVLHQFLKELGRSVWTAVYARWLCALRIRAYETDFETATDMLPCLHCPRGFRVSRAWLNWFENAFDAFVNGYRRALHPLMGREL